MAKHLLRMKFTDMPNSFPDSQQYGRGEEKLGSVDQLVSKYFPVHSLEVKYFSGQFSDIGKISIFGRDAIAEWNKTLFVNPVLRPDSPLSINPSLDSLLSSIGYKKKVIYTDEEDGTYDAGYFIFGKKFILYSQFFRRSEKGYSQLMKEEEMDQIPFFVKVQSSPDGHVDVDYAVVDAANLIYYSHTIAAHPEIVSDIKKIAKRFGYSAREFKVDHHSVDIDEILNQLIGINLIQDGNRVMTSSMHPDERRFLEKSGIDVIEIPVGRITTSGGLRCLYGELSL